MENIITPFSSLNGNNIPGWLCWGWQNQMWHPACLVSSLWGDPDTCGFPACTYFTFIYFCQVCTVPSPGFPVGRWPEVTAYLRWQSQQLGVPHEELTLTSPVNNWEMSWIWSWPLTPLQQTAEEGSISGFCDALVWAAAPGLRGRQTRSFWRH